MFTVAGIAAITGPTVLFETKEDILHFVLIAIAWPICITVAFFVVCIELYKHRISEKVKDKVDMIKKDPTSISHICIKDLRLILFANRLNAINIDDKLIDKVKSSLIDRSFEDYLLKIKDK